MRAAVSLTPREVELRELPDPACGPGDVLVRPLAVGVCGSDVNEGWVARKVPAVLGHELVADVVEAGPEVAGVAPGDRVVVHHHAPCGRCPRCERGRETLCERFRATALDPGGFAELVRVPEALAGELLPAGDLDPEVASFTEPLACVLRALGRARLRAGDGVLVVGCGSSGLLAVMAARAGGAGVVWAREPRADRLVRALALGAERHDGERADVVLVCTAKPAAVADGLAHAAPGGAVVLYGVPEPGDALAVDAWAQYAREVDLLPSYSAGPGNMEAALEHLRRGWVDPRSLVTHRVGLGEVGRALELQRTGEAVKVLVRP